MSFEEINVFIVHHGRMPRVATNGASPSVAERTLAYQLQALRGDAAAAALLRLIDCHGLLDGLPAIEIGAMAGEPRQRPVVELYRNRFVQSCTMPPM